METGRSSENKNQTRWQMTICKNCGLKLGFNRNEYYHETTVTTKCNNPEPYFESLQEENFDHNMRILAKIAERDINQKSNEVAERLTEKQVIVLSVYLGKKLCNFDDMHKDIEKRLGRPVLTHELASKKIWDEIKPKYEEDFLDMLPVKDVSLGVAE